MATEMTPDEIAKLISDKTTALNNGYISQKEYNDAVKDAKVGLKGYSAELRQQAETLKKSISGLGSKLIAGEEGSSVYNDTIKSAADTFDTFISKVPLVGWAFGKAGKALAAYMVAVNKQSDAIFQTYQDISHSGLAIGMDDTFKTLQSMGYSVKELGNMAKVLKENSEPLANLGGTAAQGVKQLADASRDIHNSGVDTELKRLGMTTDDINNGMAGYIKMQQLSGNSQKQDHALLAASATEYIKQQDLLTKLTGLNAEQQNKAYEAAMAHEEFAITQYELQKTAKGGGPGGEEALAIFERNKELSVLMTAESPGLAAGMEKFLSGGMASESARKFAQSFPNAAAAIRGGEKDAKKIMAIARAEVSTTIENNKNQARAGVSGKFVQPMSDMIKLAGSNTKDLVESSKQATEMQEEQIAGADEGASAQVKLRQSELNIAQKHDKFLNIGIVPTGKAMKALAETIENGSDVLGKLLGREGRVGGGNTFLGRITNFITGKPSGSATRSVAPPTAPGTAPTTPGAALPVDKIISFGGGTGSKNHFDQLNPTVLSNFTQMAQAYFDTTGKKLQVNSAFRSPAEQAQVNSGGNPKAAPGKSLHNVGKAVDINSGQVSELQSAGLLGKFGFSPLNGDPPHIQMPSAAEGGILSGPRTGFEAMLHGTEAVIPLPDGKTIPIQQRSDGKAQEQTKIISMKIAKLDQLIRGMQTHYDISTKILQHQS
jgi:hypothetical protein